MKVFEIKTVSRRTFMVVCKNKNQVNRLLIAVDGLKHKTIDKVKSFECIVNGINDVSAFESMARKLV